MCAGFASYASHLNQMPNPLKATSYFFYADINNNDCDDGDDDDDVDEFQLKTCTFFRNKIGDFVMLRGNFQCVLRVFIFLIHACVTFCQQVCD